MRPFVPPYAPDRWVQHDQELGVYIVTVQAPEFLAEPPRSVALTTDQYARYQRWLKRDGIIQNLLPELSASEREILMNGLDL